MSASAQTDTLCFPTETIRTVLIAAEQGKVLKEQVTLLNDRISGLEQVIELMKGKDSATVAGYEREIRLMKEQRADLEKIIRKERRKRFWATTGGTLVSAALMLLLVRK